MGDLHITVYVCMQRKPYINHILCQIIYIFCLKFTNRRCTVIIGLFFTFLYLYGGRVNFQILQSKMSNGNV